MRTPDEYFMLEVTYRVPGMAEVVVAGDIGYRMVDGDTLHADLYRPAAATSAALPAVIFVHGDAAPELLRNIKDGGQYVSWGRLVAASGLAAVTFNHRSSRRRTMMHEPASDVEALLRYVFERASDLGVDSTRLAIWVCSAGPPFVLPSLLRSSLQSVRGIVVYYGLLDIEHLRPDIPPDVSDEALREFSPLYQLQRTSAHVPPLLLVRAGRDHPWINESVDRFVAAALEKNLAIEVINLPDAEHGCDVRSNAVDVQRAVKRTLDFLTHVLASHHPSA